MPIEVCVGDVVRLRKVHPCGGFEWRVVRIGADIGLKCLTCGRHIMLPRTTFERRLKAFVTRAAASASAPTNKPEDSAVS
jgi:hypothetical protein